MLLRFHSSPYRQAATRFEQKWVQLAVEHTWESEMKRQELEEKQLAADTIPAKLAEVRSTHARSLVAQFIVWRCACCCGSI